MPHLSRSALYLCLKRWGLNNIRPTAASPQLTNRALAGPFCFDIAANQVAFHDDVFGLAFEVFLAVEEVTKDVYAEASVATPEKAGRVSRQFGRSISGNDHRRHHQYASAIRRLGQDVR